MSEVGERGSVEYGTPHDLLNVGRQKNGKIHMVYDDEDGQDKREEYMQTCYIKIENFTSRTQ